jgi:hypothetical protein
LLPINTRWAAAKVGKRQFEAAQILGKLFRSRQDDAQIQCALAAVFYLQARLAEAARVLPYRTWFRLRGTRVKVMVMRRFDPWSWRICFGAIPII